MLDRIFGCLLFACSLALLVFLQRYYDGDAQPLVLGSVLCGLLLSGMNLMRAERPHDRTLAGLCVAGNFLYALLSFAIGQATRKSPLTWGVALVCLILMWLSMRTRKRSRPM